MCFLLVEHFTIEAVVVHMFHVVCMLKDIVIIHYSVYASVFRPFVIKLLFCLLFFLI